MPGVRTLVLWDIDHTLIDIGGVSDEIYGSVFGQVTGHHPEQVADMSGRTERAIIAETLRLHHIASTEQIIATFADALAAEFAARQAEITARGRMLPGARAALSALAGRPDVVQSVLTGTMEPTALCKLAAFDLHTFVDFEVGATVSTTLSVRRWSCWRANARRTSTARTSTPRQRSSWETLPRMWTPPTVGAPGSWPWRPVPVTSGR
jgi:phosphoglycolate phosphatase-like HAD superfamily hydrolase